MLSSESTGEFGSTAQEGDLLGPIKSAPCRNRRWQLGLMSLAPYDIMGGVTRKQ